MDNLFMILVLAGIGGIFYFRKKDKKKRNISIAVAIVSFILFGITSPDVEEGYEKGVESATEEVDKEEPVEEPEEEEPEPEIEDSEVEEEPTGDKSSVELPDELKDLRLTDVRNDKTGKWRKVVSSKNFNMPENAIAYAEEYMEEDEIHWLVSFATNTTTSIREDLGMLFVTIYEYEEKSEHDANKINNGMILGEYNIYLDSGKIEDLDEVDD